MAFSPESREEDSVWFLHSNVGIKADINKRNDVKAEQMADELLSTVVAMIHHSIDPYIELLLTDTVTTMLNEFSLILAGRLENSLSRLKYSQQGVLELDKVIRGICTELINAGGSEIRTNFGKVNRLVAILSCDDVKLELRTDV